jgi:hypothetical protein
MHTMNVMVYNTVGGSVVTPDIPIAPRAIDRPPRLG